MRCINCHSPFLPLLPDFKHRQQPKRTKMVWLPTKNETARLQHGQSISSQVPLRTKALNTSLLLELASPSKPDVSVFLLTSAVLFFLFWITNFVVPEIVSKYLETEPIREDQKPKDKNEDDEIANLPSTGMQLKERGFNSTKSR